MQLQLNKRQIIASVILLFSVGGLVFYFYQRYEHLDHAQTLLAEFKTAKAITVLENYSKTLNEPDIDFESLIFYSYVKAKKFDNANEHLNNIVDFNSDFNDKFLELINLLNVTKKYSLILEMLKKAKGIYLDEDYFINLSQKQNNLEFEVNLLVAGLELIRKQKLEFQASNKQSSANINEFSTLRLEYHLLKRLIEIANIYRAQSNYLLAIEFLNKAVELNFIENSPLESEFKLNLGLNYRGIGDVDNAWKYIRESAEQGNQRAEHILEKVKEKFI